MKIFKTKDNIKPILFIKILVLFLVISVFIFIISAITIQINTFYLEKKIIERYKNTIDILKLNIDSIIKEINSEIYSYIWNDKYQQFNDSADPIADFPKGHPFLGVLSTENVNARYIHSIYFIHNISLQIIEKDKITDKYRFIKYHYPNMNSTFDLKPKYFNIYQTPTQAFRFRLNISDEIYVVPYVFFYKNNSKNALLINVNEYHIYHILNRYKLTPNSQFYIFDEYGNIFSTTDREMIKLKKINSKIYDNLFLLKKSFYDLPKKKILKEIIKKYNKPIKISINGKKYIIIIGLGKNIMPIYCALIPESDIYYNQIHIKYLIIFTSIITLIFSLILSLIFTRSIYNPISKIIRLFNPEINSSKNDKNNIDEISFIKNNIKKLIEDKKELKKEINIILPMVVENYFNKIFNDEKFPEEYEIKKYFSKNNIIFDHNNYIVVLAKLYFNGDFYDKFNRQDEDIILNQTYKLFNAEFNNFNNAYILTIENNTLAAILNVDDYFLMKNLIKHINRINNVFDSNRDYIDVFYGIGRIKKEIIGLRESYKEAILALESLSIFKKKRINIYNEKINNDGGFVYSINDENKFNNLLTCGYEKEALDLFNDIIIKNTDNKIPEKTFKELYQQIWSCIKRVSFKKKISINQLMNERYIDLFNECKKLNNDIIYDYIREVIKKLCNISKISRKRKLNLNHIIEYINQNFMNDISLDIIAHENKITVFYLSRKIKQKLGMQFQEYLNSLRIRNAKYLLINTNKTLDQIASESGYNSRQTFIRIFKKLEGINPTKYRLIQSINAKK